MSKLRQNVTLPERELETPLEGDLLPFVVFTRLKADGPFIYAGWLDAADASMALQFAREHYGQDQKCVSIWVIPKDAIHGLPGGAKPAAPASSAPRPWQVFTQAGSGDPFVSGDLVHAATAAAARDAVRKAARGHDALHEVWAVDPRRIAATAEGDLIWRYTDQSYRLARGYSKQVREKWETIRAGQDLEAYEKDDLQETF